MTYADFVAIISVLDEEEIPPPADVIDRGEGYIGRVVEVEVVDAEDILWRREDADWFWGIEYITTWGWVLEGGEQFPFGMEGTPRLEVGEEYVAAFVKAPRDGVLEWSLLSTETALPFEDELITDAGVIGGVPFSSVLVDFVGESASALVTALEQAAQ